MTDPNFERGGRLGRIELVATIRRRALEEGTSIENMLWEVVQGIYLRAIAGHTESAELMLEMFTRESLENKQKGAPTNDVRIAIVNGPPTPAADYAAEVQRVLATDLRTETARLLGDDRSDATTGR